MVNTRRKCYGTDSQPSKQPPRRTRKSVLVQPSLRSDRRLRSSAMSRRPSSVPPNCKVTNRLLLKTLNAHQAATQRTINPKDDTENLERLGISHYILKLLEDAESALPLPPSRGLTLEQRVKRIQGHHKMRECPQHKRPDVTASQALIRLQHDEILGADYESLIADYENRSPDGPPPIGASIFASRAFGGLYHKLPPDVSHEEPCLPLLISVYREHHRRLEYCCKWETQRLLHTYDLMRSGNPGQVSAPGVQALHAPACVPQL
jgi:hypothetical protein